MGTGRETALELELKNLLCSSKKCLSFSCLPESRKCPFTPLSCVPRLASQKPEGPSPSPLHVVQLNGPLVPCPVSFLSAFFPSPTCHVWRGPTGIASAGLGCVAPGSGPPGVASVPPEPPKALCPEPQKKEQASVGLGRLSNTESREGQQGCYCLSGVTFLLVKRQKHY